ncbi:MAG: oligosaccharide flippase family protein [Steroidobacteraceae bacterium]
MSNDKADAIHRASFMNLSLTRLWRRPLVGNALSLYAVQGLNYLVPLLLIPYLLRTLGPQSYGAIMFAQALMGYAVLVTDYGFNLTAARDISIARDDAVAVARIYWSTMAAKLILFLASILAAAVVILMTPALRSSWAVVACCAALPLGGVVFPQWYFQGLERLRETAVIQAMAKIVTALALITLVHSASDTLVAAFIMSAPQLAGVIAAKCLGRPIGPSIFVRPTLRDIRAALASGWHMFIVGASAALYAHTNTFVLGLMSGAQAVAVYSVGFKLVYALQSLVFPVIQAVYPRVSMLFSKDPAQAWALVTRVARLLMPAIAAASALLAIFAPYIVSVIGGKGYADAVPVTRILCIMPACLTAATLLAEYVMVNNALTKPLARIYLTVGLLNLVVLPGLVWEFSANGAALALAFAELLLPLLMIRSIAAKRRMASAAGFG